MNLHSSYRSLTALFFIFTLLVCETRMALATRGPSDTPFATSSPGFNHITHPLQPTAFWASKTPPLPTNAHWTNGLLGAGNLPTAALPYLSTPSATGMTISYPHQQCTQPACFGEPTNDFTVSAQGLTTRAMVDHDSLSWTMQWTTTAKREDPNVQVKNEVSYSTEKSKAGVVDRSASTKRVVTDVSSTCIAIPDLVDPNRWESVYPTFQCLNVTPPVPTPPPTPTGPPPTTPTGPPPTTPTGPPPTTPTGPPPTTPTGPPPTTPTGPPPTTPTGPPPTTPTGPPPTTPTGPPPTTPTGPPPTTPVSPPPQQPPTGSIPSGVITGIPANAMTVHMVYGSPYITVKYGNLIPSLQSTNALLSVNGASAAGSFSGSRFVLNYNTGNRWIVYALNGPLTLTWSGNTLSASSAYNGVIRIAAASTTAHDTLLDAHITPYAIAGSVSTNVGSTSGSYTYNWIVEGGSASNLLMLCLPHHRDSFTTTPNYLTPSWTSLKGAMVPIVAASWSFTEQYSGVNWNAPTAIDPTKVATINQNLASDLATFPPIPWDTYSFGKVIARYGRLALIADQLGNSAARDNFINRMISMFAPWFDSSSSVNSLLYDQTWGGIVSSLGVSDSGAEYGQGYYNDHHFHWGYWIYAAAVIAKFNPTWMNQYQDTVNWLVRDIANPSPNDPYFTPTRHVDWFVGHSWAAGLFPFGDVKDQESTSEAVNAYYGVYLWGLATSNTYMADFGQLLLAKEIRGAQKYWHMWPNDTSIYTPPFNQQVCAGIVWNTKVDYATWFGLNIEYIHGIQMLPYTPITEILLPSGWITIEYPLLATSITRTNPVIQVGWLGFVYMTQSIINKEAAWNNIQTLSGYDNGNSATNTAYFVATRP